MSISTQPSKMLDTADLAELCAVAKSTISRWAETGVIPTGHRVGGRRLWLATEIERWQASLGGEAPAQRGRGG